MMARVQEQRQLRSRMPLPVRISHACVSPSPHSSKVKNRQASRDTRKRKKANTGMLLQLGYCQPVLTGQYPI